MKLGPTRSYLLIVVGVVLAIWLVVVFGRALTQLNEATDRAAAVRLETIALQERLDAGRREAELVQTDAFMAMQARSFGMGRPSESAFAMAPGTATAPAVVPLGADAGLAPATTPLDSWLRLLFGG
ncbi:hypothetical protein BH24CHL7_BH24CHL7_00470 [soil metagenome]